MTKRRRTRSARLWPIPTTRIRGNPPSRNKLSRFSYQVCSKLINWQSTSLHLGSPSTRSSTPARTNLGSDIWN